MKRLKTVHEWDLLRRSTSRGPLPEIVRPQSRKEDKREKGLGREIRRVFVSTKKLACGRSLGHGDMIQDKEEG